jgi:serine/threonine protein kinase
MFYMEFNQKATHNAMSIWRGSPPAVMDGEVLRPLDMYLKNALPKGYMLHSNRIEKTVGGGGFSIVYLATELEANQRVIIKEYLPTNRARRAANASVECVSDQTSSNFHLGMRRFFDEAAALAKVNHPNIVRVTDFFRANNTVYMVMDYERGKDLRWYIKKRSGKVSERFIRTVFPQLLHGLHELHNNKLLHLDIKPANILVRPGGKPLLLDFGAARESLGTKSKHEPHTLTSGFAPIEQHRRGHMGPWTDIYAIGATLWACMSGKAPIPSTERYIKDKQKLSVRRFAGRYSKALLEMVDWCLQINQLDRPQSCQELINYMNKLPNLTHQQPGKFDFLTRLNVRLPWDKG